MFADANKVIMLNSISWVVILSENLNRLKTIWNHYCKSKCNREKELNIEDL